MFANDFFYFSVFSCFYFDSNVNCAGYVTVKIVWPKWVRGNNNENSVFAKTNVKTSMYHVLNNCCYIVGDVAFTQAISYYYYEIKRLLCNQEAYIKYVGERVGEFNKFFKKIFVAHGTIELNFSWPSNFCGKYFMAPPISFSFLFKAYL